MTSRQQTWLATGRAQTGHLLVPAQRFGLGDQDIQLLVKAGLIRPWRPNPLATTLVQMRWALTEAGASAVLE